MKTPAKRTIIVEVVYYDCEHPEHRHRLESAAIDCIEKSERRKVKTDNMQRDIAIVRAILSGKSTKDAGNLFGLSGSRAVYIFYNVMHRIQRTILPIDDNGERKDLDCFYYGIQRCRKHANKILKYVDCLAEKYYVR